MLEMEINLNILQSFFLSIFDRILPMICMISKVNLGVEEMGVVFHDLYNSLK